MRVGSARTPLSPSVDVPYIRIRRGEHILSVGEGIRQRVYPQGIFPETGESRGKRGEVGQLPLTWQLRMFSRTGRVPYTPDRLSPGTLT